MPTIDPKKLSPSGKVRFWKGQLEAWARGDLSLDEYCRRHGLPRSAMGYWKRKLGMDNLQSSITLVQVPIQATEFRTGDEKGSDSPLHVLAGRYWIEIGADFNPTLLTKLVRTLERVR